jgi:hypothetical protein
MGPRFSNPLDNVRIAAPCKADWEQMSGDDRRRFCGQCQSNVYNLSSMTRAEAEHLIVNAEGRLCLRYFRRADGSILTKNCPVGLREIRRRVSYLTRAAVSALLTFFAGVGIYRGLSSWQPISQPPLMGTIAVKTRFELTPSQPGPSLADWLSSLWINDELDAGDNSQRWWG